MIDSSNLRVACIIPSYNGKDELSRLLISLKKQTVSFKIFVVDSSSTDGSLEVAHAYADGVTIIDSREFNHGGTRQLMAESNPGYDVYIYLTQDAYLEDTQAIARILAPFADAKVGAVCGRQLPHLNANLLAQHAREFNYPAQSQVKSMDDVPQQGLKAAFMSNSFAAYRASALQEVGGFPSHVIFGEDMYVAAKMIMAGWRVAYAGDAVCRHSHNYSLMEEWSRYFDMGVFHAREPWIRQWFGGAGGEGLKYVKSELRFLGVKKLYLWPSALLRNALKLAAYKVGQQERYLPVYIKRKIGMYKRYWDGPFAERHCNM